MYSIIIYLRIFCEAKKKLLFSVPSVVSIFHQPTQSIGTTEEGDQEKHQEEKIKDTPREAPGHEEFSSVSR